MNGYRSPLSTSVHGYRKVLDACLLMLKGGGLLRVARVRDNARMDDLQRLAQDLADALIAEPDRVITGAWLERVAKRLLDDGWSNSTPVPD